MHYLYLESNLSLATLLQNVKETYALQCRWREKQKYSESNPVSLVSCSSDWTFCRKLHKVIDLCSYKKVFQSAQDKHFCRPLKATVTVYCALNISFIAKANTQKLICLGQISYRAWNNIDVRLDHEQTGTTQTTLRCILECVPLKIKHLHYNTVTLTITHIPSWWIFLQHSLNIIKNSDNTHCQQ